MSFQGLINCTDDPSSPPCIEKAIQFTFSLILLIAIVVSLILRIRYERQFNLYVVINLMMILSLLFNLLYCLFHMTQLYLIQSLFIDCYFPTLVFKFAIKLLQKQKEKSKKLMKISSVFFSIYLSLTLSIFIYRNVKPHQVCKEIPYLVMNVMGVTLSIWLVVFGIKHSEQELKQQVGIISVVAQPEAPYNPMPKMWKCIIINIVSMIVGLIRTIYYMAASEMHCLFSHNERIEFVLQFIILVLTFYMGMVATLFFFHQKGKSYLHWYRTNLRKSSDDGKVQLIEAGNFESNLRDKSILT